ncbi:MAG: exodeoxyribonuclease VII small subunit [Halioglobus sp.]
MLTYEAITNAIVEVPKMADEDSQKNFEHTLASLESTIDKLENNETNLEDALKSFEEGIVLTRHAQTMLRDAEQKVQLLIADESENPKSQDFSDEPTE